MDRISQEDADKMTRHGEFTMFHIDWREQLMNDYPECSHFLFKSSNRNWRTNMDSVVLVVGDHDHICAGVIGGRITPDVVETLIANDDKLGRRLWRMNAQKSARLLIGEVEKLVMIIDTECAKVGYESQVIEILDKYSEKLEMFNDMASKGYYILPDGRYELPTTK